MLTINCILDTFSYHCFSSEARLLPLALDGEMSADADLLLVESAWNSYGGGWYLGDERYREQITRVLGECRRRGIPTVFWAKEDPVQTHRFNWITPMFDYVFTTDADSVDAHRAATGHDRVGVLPFAAQPSTHYHDPLVQRKPRPAFAGVHYSDILPERARETEYVLLPAVPYGLDLFDRGTSGNFYLQQRTFPPAFDAAVRPGVPYEEVPLIYRSYKVFMNVGCVSRSPTMFSRRVFEVLASGTPLISAYSVGIEAMFGGVVHLSRDERETEEFLKLLLTDETYWSVSSLQSQRAVLRGHTYAHRLKTILEACGIPLPSGVRDTIGACERAALATSQDELTAALRSTPVVSR